MAEREGFEPSVLLTYARFPGVCLKPLSHLSTDPEKMQKIRGCRNDFLKIPKREVKMLLKYSPAEQQSSADQLHGYG